MIVTLNLWHVLIIAYIVFTYTYNRMYLMIAVESLRAFEFGKMLAALVLFLLSPVSAPIMSLEHHLMDF